MRGIVEREHISRRRQQNLLFWEFHIAASQDVPGLQGRARDRIKRRRPTFLDCNFQKPNGAAVGPRDGQVIEPINLDNIPACAIVCTVTSLTAKFIKVISPIWRIT